jgi:hypothetical protein
VTAFTADPIKPDPIPELELEIELEEDFPVELLRVGG